MADDLTGTPTPVPQATGNTPAGTAADLADIAPVPAPEDTIRQAALGDQGAENYAALLNAGRQAATPTAVPTGTTPPPTLPAPPPDTTPGGIAGLAGVKPGAFDPIAGALMGLATGNPLAGRQALMQRQQAALAMQQHQIAAQREFRENASEFYTALVPAAFKQFPGRPDLAAAFLQNAAAQRGLHVDPTVLTALNQDFIDGKLTSSQMNDIIADPNTPIDVIQRFGAKAKLVNDAIEARGHAIEATNKATASATAPAEAQAKLIGQQLANQFKTMDIGAFYDSIERKVAAEANQQGLKPGTPQYTNYTEARKAQLDAYAKRQIFLNTPLTGRNAEDFNQADRVSKFASAAQQLLNDPQVAGDRGVLEGRLRNLAWRMGFAQSENEDLYQSISNISGLMGSKVYSGGIRNMKWIDKVLEHTLKPGDDLNLLKDKIVVLQKAAYEQQQGIINTASTPIGQLKPTAPAPGPLGGTRETAPVSVTTPDEAASLVPGTQFVTPDGQVRVRR